MKKRILLISVFACIGITTLYLLMTHPFHRAPLPGVAEDPNEGSGRAIISRNSRTPAKRIDSWETWLTKQTDIVLEEMLRYLNENEPWDVDDFESDMEAREKFVRAKLQEMMTELKKSSNIPPPLRVIPLEELFADEMAEPAPPKKHEGPQTAKAILKTFEGMLYTTPELEAAYPESEFLQMLLDRGITIDDYLDYSGYMSAREDLYWLDQNPDKREWFAFANNVEYTDNSETLSARFIEDRIRDYGQLKAAVDADPRVIGGYHEKDGRFLPIIPGRVYIQLERNEDGGHSMGVMGEELTEEQKFNIFYRGIEPQGYEVIYLDASYDTLQEPFQPLTPKEVLPPEKYEEYLQRKKQKQDNLPIFEEDREFLNENTDWNNGFEDFKKRVESERAEFERAEFERVVLREEQEAQFTQAMETLVRWSSMSDAEIVAELEKMFTPEGVANQLQEQLISKPPTPESIDKALETLHLHGPTAGLKQLREADPEIARQMEQQFKRPTPSRRPVPSRAKHRTTPPPKTQESHNE